MNLSLFESEPEPSRKAESPLATRLRRLADEGIFVGTSSWKYPGWIGQVYTAERYFTRGRFSQKKFQEECLREYAETFPAVCGDFAFYNFLTEEQWARFFALAPPGLIFAFKTPEMITVRNWPVHARYGARAGQPNESFLDARLFASAFLTPLERYRDRIGVIILEFGTFSRQHYPDVQSFCEHLHLFLECLPKGWRYAVEVRNWEFFDWPYFDCLRDHNVAHVMNAWTRVPELIQQVSLPEAYTADFAVARALLKQGRTYEEAVREFQPYSVLRDPHEPAREGLRKLMARVREQREPAFLFVNNRLEGNAPSTIQAVTDSGSTGESSWV